MAFLLGAAPVRAELVNVDVDKVRSELSVTLQYGGILGLFGKEHRMPVERWLASVRYDAGNPEHSRVQVMVPAGSLVLTSEGRAELQAQLTGPKGLDVGHYPQIQFVSTAVAPGEKKDELKITGNLTIRGKTRPIQFVTRIQDAENDTLRFTGSMRFRQSEFGIESQAKDEVEVTFDFYSRPRTAVAAISAGSGQPPFES
jgi:polyisoprenoid-binding protein YceI